jgi:phosphotransferase family enzyme
MSTPAQLDHGLFRILLHRDDATQLLLESDAGRLRLPAVPVAPRTRVAEEITAAIKNAWNLEAYCLFTLPSNDTTRFAVLETSRHDAATPPGMQWLPVLSCSVGSFENPADYAALQNSLAALDQYRRGELLGPFGKPGWPRKVTDWVEAQAARFGLRPNGRFRQFNASPTFSLIRFETNGPALWFKAVGEPNLHEYSITLKLATLLSTFVPRVIASKPEWNAWLSVEAEGAHLDSTTSDNDWLSIATSLANLQLASFGNGLHLIEAGCKDVRACSLQSLVDPFFDGMAELMAQQVKHAPPPLSRQEISVLASEIHSSLQELSNSAVPNVLGHLDFNPGNILVSRERCIFLDWAEGCVGHPFFTFQYLLEHSRRLRGLNASFEKALLSVYTAQWQSYLSPRDIATVIRLVPLLAAFAYAANTRSWRSSGSLRPGTAGYFRSLTRRMNREAQALRERSFTCVP